MNIHQTPRMQQNFSFLVLWGLILPPQKTNILRKHLQRYFWPSEHLIDEETWPGQKQCQTQIKDHDNDTTWLHDFYCQIKQPYATNKNVLLEAADFYWKRYMKSGPIGPGVGPCQTSGSQGSALGEAAPGGWVPIICHPRSSLKQVKRHTSPSAINESQFVSKYKTKKVIWPKDLLPKTRAQWF